MSNLLIVESKNDEFFIKALVDHLNITNIDIGKPICSIQDYKCLEGLSLNNLILRLEAFKNSLPKNDIEAVGIILDNDGQKKKSNWVNKSGC
ncbi:MAG: hypothetical protein HQK72_11770 [Desulfamplus sp.]|nr:hypothetical protein [Desulfamplus sp.]